MKNMNLAARYARAIYETAKESGEQDLIFTQMRSLSEGFSQDSNVVDFLHSPVVRPLEKEKALAGLLAAVNVVGSLRDFVLLLAKKTRLKLLPEILTSFQQIADEAHGVTRGAVRSATVLAPSERQRIEGLVSKATKKQVILTYKEDPTLLGGLVAEVGSLTFDDSLTSHLKRMNEQLTRSAH